MSNKMKLAARLGLRPYTDFEKIMTPLFKRIAPEERDRVVQQLYELAGEKLVMDQQKKGIEKQAQALKTEFDVSSAMVRSLERVFKELNFLQGKFRENHPAWSELQTMMESLGKLGDQIVDDRDACAELFNALIDPEGRLISTNYVPGEGAFTKISLIPPDDVPADLSTTEDFSAVFPGLKDTAIDGWLIQKIDNILPPPPDRKLRSRFNRAKIMEELFAFIRQGRGLSSFQKAASKRNTRPKS